MATLLPLVRQIIAMQGWREDTYQARYLTALAQHGDGCTLNDLTFCELFSEKERRGRRPEQYAAEITARKKKFPPASHIQKLNASLDRLYERPDASHLLQRISVRHSPVNRQLRVLECRDNVAGTVRRFWAPHLEGVGLNVIGYASPLFFRDPTATQFVRRIDINSRDQKAHRLPPGVTEQDFLFVTRGELHLMTELVKLLAKGDNIEYDGIKHETSLTKVTDMSDSLHKRQPLGTPNVVHAVLTGSTRTNHAIELYQTAKKGWATRLRIRSTDDGATGFDGTRFRDSYDTDTIRSYVVITQRPGELTAGTTCTLIASNGSRALEKMAATLTRDAELLDLLAAPCEHQAIVNPSGNIDASRDLLPRPIDVLTSMRNGRDHRDTPHFQLLVEVDVRGEARAPSQPRLVQAVWYERG